MKRVRASLVLAICALLADALGSSASAQTAANVLVVANAASAASIEIAEYYASRRAVPPDQVLRLQLPTTDEIARTQYDSQVERPITEWLMRHSAQDRILYIVLTKGVPLRISGSSGTKGTVASVDSELTLLYRKMSGVVFALNGWLPNPYFLGDRGVNAARRFTHEYYDLYLVTRLDGFSVADVKTLIDRGTKPSRQGAILLDARSEVSTSPGNTWLEDAAAGIRGQPGWTDRVVHDTRFGVVAHEQPLLGYYSWGSNDPAFFLTDSLNLDFVPGALAGMFVSTDARTFQQPPADWRAGKGTFAGSNQSLIGTLIRQGATGAAGHVAEPYLTGAIRPDVLFPSYLNGFNLAEAFYLAMPYSSWQTVVIGDPLCAPFQEEPLSDREIDRGIDPSTELPAYLSDRRLLVMTASGIKEDAAKLFLKAEARLLRKDTTVAREALEQATAADPSFGAAHLILASVYSANQQWDSAIERYRRILERLPNDFIALNNLAFLLAERKNRPAEALPLADRAYTMSKGNAAVADTLGWIYHLLDDDHKAASLLEAAAKATPSNAETQLHAAIVLAKVGQSEAATQLLERALTLDNHLEERDSVQQLRTLLAR